MSISKQEIVDYLLEIAGREVYRAILADLKTPIGRPPPPKLTEASRWFLSLSAEAQDHLKLIVEESANASLYRVLIAFDGRTALPNGVKGFRVLVDIEGQSEPFVLNSDDPPELTEAYKERKAPWGMTHEEWEGR